MILIAAIGTRIKDLRCKSRTVFRFRTDGYSKLRNENFTFKLVDLNVIVWYITYTAVMERVPYTKPYRDTPEGARRKGRRAGIRSGAERAKQE